MWALWAAMMISASAVDVIEMDIMTLQHDTARAQRHIKEQLDGLNRAERNIAQLVEEVIGLRGEVKRLQGLETEVRELRALLGTRPEPGVLYELPAGHERRSPPAGDERRDATTGAGHEREATVAVTTAGDDRPEAQIATRAAAS